MARLSTHVLDTANGKPAANVAIELHALMPDGSWKSVGEARTNGDGRTDQPLLSGTAFKVGTYMLSFRIADYFAERGTAQSQPPFLDIVQLRFTIGEPDGHYHVPLLVSPWSYSTYRGS